MSKGEKKNLWKSKVMVMVDGVEGEELNFHHLSIWVIEPSSNVGTMKEMK